MVCKKKCFYFGVCNSDEDVCCEDCFLRVFFEDIKVCKFGSKIFRVCMREVIMML